MLAAGVPSGSNHPMSAFDDGGLDDRLDRACEAADKAPPEEALAQLRAVRAELEASADRLATSDSALDDLARCRAAESTAHARAGRPADALAAVAEAMELHRRAAAMDPLGDARERQIAELRVRSTAYLRDAGRVADALDESVAAAEILERLAPADDPDPDMRAVEAAADARGAAFLASSALGRAEAALRHARAAIAHRRRVARDAEAQSDAKGQLYSALLDLAWELDHDGRHADALATCGEARGVAEAAVAADPFATRWQRSLAAARAASADYLRALGRLEDAERELTGALFIAETLVSLEPGDNVLRIDLMRRWQDLADFHLARGNVPALLDAARRRVEAATRLDPADPVAESAARSALAHAHIEADDGPSALVAADAAIAALGPPVAAAGARGDAPSPDVLVHLGIAHDYAARATRETGDMKAATARWEVSLGVLRRATANAPGRDWITTTLWRVLRIASSHLRNIDEDAAAEPLLAEAVRIRTPREMLPPDAPDAARATGPDASPRVLRELAETADVHAALLEYLGRDRDAIAPARLGLAARDRIAAISSAAGAPNTPSAQSAVWERRRLGYLLWRTDDTAGAEAEFRRAKSEAEGGLASAPQDVDWIAPAAAASDSLGDFLADRNGPGDAAESLDLAVREAELAGRRADAEPDNAMSQRAGGIAHRDLGVALRAAGRIEEAEATLTRALAFLSKARALDATDDVAHLWTSYAHFDRGGVREQRKDLPAALADYIASRDIDVERLAVQPEDRSRRFALAASLQAIHGIAKDAGSPDLEEPSARQELTLRRQLADGGSDADEHNLRWALHRFARTLTDVGRSDEARAAAAESLAASQAFVDAHPGDLAALGLLANALETSADAADRDDPAQVAAAAARYRAVLAIFEGRKPTDVSHREDCTCVADATRKLAELPAPPAVAVEAAVLPVTPPEPEPPTQ